MAAQPCTAAVVTDVYVARTQWSLSAGSDGSDGTNTDTTDAIMAPSDVVASGSGPCLAEFLQNSKMAHVGKRQGDDGVPVNVGQGIGVL